MMATIEQSEGMFLNEAIQEFGKHVFIADGKPYTFSHMSVLFNLQGYEDYVGYQELGTVTGNTEVRTYRTILTKVPPMALHEIRETHGEVVKAFGDIVSGMMSQDKQQPAAALADLSKIYGRYGRMIEASFHMDAEDQVIFYHDKNLITDELASETTRPE